MECYSIQSSPWRDTIVEIQLAALAAVEPSAAVHRHVRREGDRFIVDGNSYDLAAIHRVLVVGGGKAATAMAGAVSELLGDHLAGGLVVTKYGHRDPKFDTGRVQVMEGGHPIPDEAGVRATRNMVDSLRGLTEHDLVVSVISGGGSALMTLPAAGLGLHDVQHTTDLLLRSGATIIEVNAVRKHLSAIKGGELVRSAAPARVISLVLSDVVGDPLETIASGPTVPDASTFGDTWKVLERYGLTDRVPPAVQRRIRVGLDGRVPESPKPGSPLFRHVRNTIVASNRLAAEAAVQAAQCRGLNASLLSTFVEGEAREVARVAAALVREVVHFDRPVAKPACLVWGGETTVTVRGEGRGGRNQELALAAASQLDGLPGVVLVALGTDGTDGPTDAAGAVATGETVTRARAVGIDTESCLLDNNSYAFFDAIGDLIRTGPTGTNVNDLLFLFVLPSTGSEPL